MASVLHLVRDPASRVALDVIAQHARDPAVRLSVVLLQGAAAAPPSLPGQVFRLVEGPDGAASSPYPSIDHSRLLDLIFAADTVVTW